MIQAPVFTISLDFELFWGVRDHRTIDDYGHHLLGTRNAITEMLKLFEDYEIHATWATVGLLFYSEKKTLLSDLPEKLPSYKNQNYSPYPALKDIGENEFSDPYHYGLSIIKQIQKVPFQEIGTHTYSHYYCLEEGQTIEEFRADIIKAVEVAARNNIQLKSIIFPRNQFNEEYLKIIEANNIRVYRGNETSWLYNARNRDKESFFRRALRMADSFLDISGHHVHDLSEINKDKSITNIPSSRFLRPYSTKLSSLEFLKILRIKNDMLAAAQQKKTFHLWWHPHNFGTHTTENIKTLKSILDYYILLKKTYGMVSLNMAELEEIINEQK